MIELEFNFEAIYYTEINLKNNKLFRHLKHPSSMTKLVKIEKGYFIQKINLERINNR